MSLLYKKERGCEPLSFSIVALITLWEGKNVAKWSNQNCYQSGFIR